MEDILAIIYIGYGVNKFKKIEINRIFPILSKLIKVEESFHTLDPETMLNNKCYPDMETEHDFDIRGVKLIAEALHEELIDTHGPGVKTKIGDEWLTRVGRTNLTDLATLKASSAADPGPKKASIDKKVNIANSKKSKVIIEILDLINEGYFCSNCPFVDMKKILEELESDGFLLYTFPKQQHGGQRKIFMMNLKARLMQYSFETLARVICELIPCEAMTHPNEKRGFAAAHEREVLRTFKAFPLRQKDNHHSEYE